MVGRFCLQEPFEVDIEMMMRAQHIRLAFSLTAKPRQRWHFLPFLQPLIIYFRQHNDHFDANSKRAEIDFAGFNTSRRT